MPALNSRPEPCALRWPPCAVLLSLLFASSSCNALKKGPTETAATSSAVLGNETAPAPKAPLKAGEQVFNFTALAHNGQRLRVSEFLRRPVLVYFCAADRDPRCQQLALSLRDHWLTLNPSLSMAFGVTTEDTVIHRDFAAEHALPHLLIADSDNSVRRVFGVAPAATTAFLINGERQIVHVFTTLNAASFAQDVLTILKQLGLERSAPPM
jgi:thioredoxin-dependent peroxiredoxin